jgi:hypothetical protein
MRRYRKSDPDFYGLKTPVTSAAVKIRGATATPETVKPGSVIVAKTDYSVVTPPGEATVSVTESWILKKDGKTLVDAPLAPQQRATGGWETSADVPVPNGAPTGTYILEHKVQTGTSYDTRISSFVVK